MQSDGFEGSEKKVEVVVAPAAGSLLERGEDFWYGVVQAAGAQVLSCTRNRECSSFLLSESSLFVRDSAMTMITCGQTRLADAIEYLLRYVSAKDIQLLLYERKDALYPELQTTTFLQDTARLSRVLAGRALRFGDEHGRGIDIYCGTNNFVPRDSDRKFELLMHGISANASAHFQFINKPKNHSIAKALELDALISGYEISEHSFDPIGYSLNALNGDRYFALHVTPERTESYASFETNHDLQGMVVETMERLLTLFAPRSFDVFVLDISATVAPTLADYRLHKHQTSELGGYQATFLQYFGPFEGPRPAHVIDLEKI